MKYRPAAAAESIGSFDGVLLDLKHVLRHLLEGEGRGQDVCGKKRAFQGLGVVLLRGECRAGRCEKGEGEYRRKRGEEDHRCEGECACGHGRSFLGRVGCLRFVCDWEKGYPMITPG